jgi:radical SAM superfamily enzyme YgiQ (UPF0313 family)
MTKLKILLIYPSCLYAPNWGKKDNLKAHMLHLFSFLKFNNIEVEVLDLENEIGRPENEDDVTRFREKSAVLISQYDFDTVGISCWSSLDYLSSTMIAEICRNINSKCITVVGGYHPSAVPSDFLYDNSPFDFIVTGEGEIALLNICIGNIKRENVPRVIKGTALDLRKKFPLYWQEYPYIKKHSINNIYLSRGCPYSCSFCMEQSKGSMRWRSYSVDESINNITSLIDILNPKQIFIRDACFGVDNKWRKKFLSGLNRCKIDKIIWVETRIELFDKEDIDLLTNLNFVVAFGIESFSERMLQIMKKTNNPKQYIEKFLKTLSYFNEKEVPYHVFLMFNHPGETYETYNETLNFCKSFVREQSKISGFIGGSNYVFFPGSEIYMNLKAYEERFGTTVQYKEWWKEKENHYKLASSVIASSSLKDKFGEARNYWQQEINEINQQIIKKMPTKKRLFWYVKTENEKDMMF